MKVVHRKDAKALKGDKSFSYQVISPDNVGSRKFLVTVVDIRPGGSTPVHEHRTIESMYYILDGRGEVTSGREHKILGPDTAVYFPAGSTHGIPNARTSPPPPHREARLIGHCETRSVIESYPDAPFGNGGKGVES